MGVKIFIFNEKYRRNGSFLMNFSLKIPQASRCPPVQMPLPPSPGGLQMPQGHLDRKQGMWNKV
jgi:hypothetical protein